MTEPVPDIAERFAAGTWAFTAEVAEVFDEHVRASVPYYDAIQALVAEASDWLVPAGGLVADLGAATGATVAAIMSRHPERSIRAALYDEQPAMLAKATARLIEPIADDRVGIYPRRIEDGPLSHEGADLTLSLFTLQFMAPADRRTALSLARKSAADTGALIVAEKLRPVDVRWAEMANEASHDWKAAHGIEAEAIRAKARALRGVLMPLPLSDLVTSVREAGWHSTEVLFRWHQWAVLGAFASGQD